MGTSEIQVKEYKSQYATCLGHTFQLIVYVLNGILYLASLAMIIAGLVIGMDAKVIRLKDFWWKELVLYNPATIFFIYGLFLSLVTLVGCFSSASGNRYVTIIYLIAITLVIVYDSVWGIHAFTKLDSLKDFKTKWNKTMRDYGSKEKQQMAIYLIKPNEYWDTLQHRGGCCGYMRPKDWEGTRLYHENQTYPDSCCNKKYYSPGCGKAMFNHPDTNNHTSGHMVHTKSCTEIFGSGLVEEYDNTGWVGILMMTMLLFCALLSIVILIMVIANCYEPSKGPGDTIFKKSSAFLRALNDKNMEKTGRSRFRRIGGPEKTVQAGSGSEIPKSQSQSNIKSKSTSNIQKEASRSKDKKKHRHKSKTKREKGGGGGRKERGRKKRKVGFEESGPQVIDK